MKPGDILICKKELNINGQKFFLYNKSYKISTIDYINYNISLCIDDLYTVVFDLKYDAFYGNVKKYFYTLEEIRKFKIESL